MLSRLLPSAQTDPELARLRPGLVFSFFNAMTWQIAIGTPLVLFAEQLGASADQVGLAYSLVFLLTPVQILSTALLPRFGYKRLMLGGWGIRSFLLLVPITLAVLAPQIGVRPWMASALIGAIFFFCLFRAIGLAANLPWFYAIIPPTVRGRYFSNDSVLAGVSSVLTLVVCAGLFAVLPVYAALGFQYGIALAGSAWSYYALRRLPDGPPPEPLSLRVVLKAVPKIVTAPSEFRRYLYLSLACFAATSPIPPFVTYYLKTARDLAPGWIMAMEVLRYGGVILAALIIRRRIDTVGARPFMLISLGLYLALSLYWVFEVHYNFGGPFGLVTAYVVLGLGGTSWTVGNLTYLPKIVPAEQHTLMISVYGALTALVAGLSTLGWGWVLRPGGALAGVSPVRFQLFFALSVVVTAILSYLLARRPEPDAEPADPLMVVNAVLRPGRAMSYLINLVEPPKPARTPAPTK
jgi:MFS family permease